MYFFWITSRVLEVPYSFCYFDITGQHAEICITNNPVIRSCHIANIIKGVSEGFSKTLELNGTGYRASISGSKLKLQLGYSHDIDFEVPKEVRVECPKQNIIKLSSSNKEILGAVAANIRSFRKPEPFKGKGIKYENEYIFRKESKKK